MRWIWRGAWTWLTCRRQLFRGPAVRSCRSCTRLPASTHVSVGRTRQSGRKIAAGPTAKAHVNHILSGAVPHDTDAFLHRQLLRYNTSVIYHRHLHRLRCLFTFQTEKAKLMSGTLSRVSSSSISTAEVWSNNNKRKKSKCLFLKKRESWNRHNS